MSAADDLAAIADQMQAILERFLCTRDGVWIADGDQSSFTGLVLEAREMMAEGLGPLNNFGHQLERTRIEGITNYVGSQSRHSVEQAIGIIRSAVNVLRRRQGVPTGVAPGIPYVNFERIEQLRSVASPSWDLQRLVRMCEELNSVFAASNFLATAMLVRAIIDHVPPLFGAQNFAKVAATTSGKSTKANLERLQTSLRNVADTWLHQQIRTSETLPTATQVSFGQELDVLLGEVVRVMRENDRGR